MKTTYIVLLVLIGAFLIVYFLVPSKQGPGEYSGIAKTPEKFEIEFVVDDSQAGGPSLEIVTSSQGCAKEAAGCIRVKAANSGNITFKFGGVQKLPCSDNPDSWFISKVELADFAGSFGGPVSQWIADDFGADRKTGLVWAMEQGQESAVARIQDANKHTGVAYYNVTVESCSLSRKISTDPRIENEGIGY